MQPFHHAQYYDGGWGVNGGKEGGGGTGTVIWETSLLTPPSPSIQSHAVYIIYCSTSLALINICIKRQALTKGYSPHNLRSVGISNKSEFNTAKMGLF